MARVLRFLASAVLVAFPACPALRAADPRTADPPLPHAPDAELCAEVPIIAGAQLTQYYETVRAGYMPPSNCSQDWDQVILEVTGAVQGLQFDRFGGIWLRGVEILRTTTPEPTQAGIAWQILKDLTDYATLFEEPGEVALEIPNIVNKKYTGVLHMNVTFLFYRSAAAPPPVRWVVLPLRNLSGVGSPVDAMALNGPGGQTSFISLPPGASEALLDVYASGHACEEFWYSNPVAELAAEDDCAGGAYRELLVYVDGVLAGAQYPYPVVYTGGIHPLLWRPLTGILSFDIPAYRFDLTPFLAWLTDGRRHNVTIAVYHEPPDGTWFLQGVLLLNVSSERAVVRGSVEVLPALAEVDESANNASDLQWTHGRREYHVRGELLFNSGEHVTSEVQGSLTMRIENTDETASGVLACNSSILRRGLRETIAAEYPFDMVDIVLERSNTSETRLTTATWGRKLHVSFDAWSNSPVGEDAEVMHGFSSAAENSISSRVISKYIYNSSKPNHHIVRTEYDYAANESSRLWTSGSSQQGFGLPCFEASLSSVNGRVIQGGEDAASSSCSWPHGVYFCGNTFCGDFARGTGVVRAGGTALELGFLLPQPSDAMPAVEEELLQYPVRQPVRMARRQLLPNPLLHTAPATPTSAHPNKLRERVPWAASGSHGGAIPIDASHFIAAAAVLLTVLGSISALLTRQASRRGAILDQPLLQA